MSIEAMKQALEFIGDVYAGEWHGSILRREQVEQSLRQAIAEAEKQEPVAWQWLTTAHFRKKLPKDAEKGAWNPLYTTPQQRKPLTDEQIEQIENGIWRPEFFDDVERQANREFARAIEAAHGIKE